MRKVVLRLGWVWGHSLGGTRESRQKGYGVLRVAWRVKWVAFIDGRVHATKARGLVWLLLL